MIIKISNGRETKTIADVIHIDIIDDSHPAYVILRDGTELRIRIDRITEILDDEEIYETRFTTNGHI